jgi:hypothetical protein
MVQARDRHEGATRAALHDLAGREQGSPHHVRRRFVHPAPCRRIAGIQEALAGERAIRDQVEVLGRVEGFELATCGGAGFHEPDPLV